MQLLYSRIANSSNGLRSVDNLKFFDFQSPCSSVKHKFIAESGDAIVEIEKVFWLGIYGFRQANIYFSLFAKKAADIPIEQAILVGKREFLNVRSSDRKCDVFVWSAWQQIMLVGKSDGHLTRILLFYTFDGDVFVFDVGNIPNVEFDVLVLIIPIVFLD